MTTPNFYYVDKYGQASKCGVTVAEDGTIQFVTLNSSGQQVVFPNGGVSPATSISPAAAGSGLVGSSALYARQDHTHPVGSGVPIPLSANTTLANLAHNGNNLILSSTPALNLPAGLMAGFGCGIDGTFTLAGGLTIGSGVTDKRNTTGTATCALVQTAADGSAYELWGSK